MKAKSPSESETIKTEVVCPNDTNPMGLLQGGRLVQWMDIAAAICAQTHAEKICVTASIDNVNFKNSARAGDVITIKARITRAFETSMEIFVETHSKNVLSRESHLINEAYFTFVALDDHARVTPVMSVRPGTKVEKEQYANALKRKQKKSLMMKRQFTL
jgi:acyl-CoA hydrolase